MRALLCLLMACSTLEEFEDPAKVDSSASEPESDTPEADDSGNPEPADTGTPQDADGDGIPNNEDLCPGLLSAENGDLDGDLRGDPCDEDRDGDEIPNPRDLFPEDPTLPGVASQDHVYAHGPYDLWRLDVPSRQLQSLGGFRFDRRAGSITDVAIDRYGVLYAVSFSDAFVCSPDTAECWWIGALPGSYNGLTFVPDDLGQEDVLVGIATGGVWTGFRDVPLSFTSQPWGGYGSGFSSSGDAFHIRGQGTYAAVNQAGRSSVVIVEVDTRGRVVREVVEITGTYGVYGIGGWTETIFAFASGGDIFEIKPATGAYSVIARNPGGWWGAGVKTIVVP